MIVVNSNMRQEQIRKQNRMELQFWNFFTFSNSLSGHTKCCCSRITTLPKMMVRMKLIPGMVGGACSNSYKQCLLVTGSWTFSLTGGEDGKAASQWAQVCCRAASKKCSF